MRYYISYIGPRKDGGFITGYAVFGNSYPTVTVADIRAWSARILESTPEMSSLPTIITWRELGEEREGQLPPA